ncbi:hypothetical protein Hanom_Chr16g01458451 [Helianthus anomalus]
MGTNGIRGHYVQNKYILLRQDVTEQKIIDGDLADQLHPSDILFMKNHYEKERCNNQFVRRALKRISKAGIKLFERITFADFDLCINYDYVH